jgi:hypothetical protein
MTGRLWVTMRYVHICDFPSPYLSVLYEQMTHMGEVLHMHVILSWFWSFLMCNVKICTVCAVVTFVYKAWDCDCLLFLNSGTSGAWSISFFPHGLTASSGPRLPYCRGFGSHSDTTFGRTFLDEWSACRRDVCLTTHNPHKRQTSMPPAGFEPTIPAS